MLEAELAFADMHDAMAVAEACLKHCGQAVLNNHSDDVAMLAKSSDKSSSGSPSSKGNAATATTTGDKGLSVASALSRYCQAWLCVALNKDVRRETGVLRHTERTTHERYRVPYCYLCGYFLVVCWLE